MMDNAEEIMQSLEEFSKIKPKVIPRELEDYLGYVAKSGDPVFKWSLVKFLFREKMLSVINDFFEDTLTIELPPCPNVDPFNYDRMKSSLLERLEAFHGAPFTIQRICELLTNPRKEYNRADKFMRAIEKNILVVSTREPGRFADVECETTQEYSINGIREVDNLDSTFIINDLGGGPDSSPNAELNDSLPDANHLNTVERVSPVHDQDVSSDSDDNALENGQISEERPLERTNGLDNQHLMVEESNGSNVSSTDMNISLEGNNLGEVQCETTGNSVTSSHETVISNQQIGFIASPSIGEVMGAVESSPVESLESCILPDGSLLNEVINQQPSNASEVVSQQPPELIEVNKSDDSESCESLVEQSDSQNEDTSPESNIEAVECDTSQSQVDRDKCDDGSLNPNSSINLTETPSVINQQVSSCDTTESSNESVPDYSSDSGEVLNAQPEPTSDPTSCTEIITQSEVMSQSDMEGQPDILAQSDIIDQSDVAQCNLEQSDIVAQSDGISASDIDTNSEFVAQSNVVAQSDTDVVAPSHTDAIDQSEIVAQSDSVSQVDDTPADSGTLAQSDVIDQSDSVSSETLQSDVLQSSGEQVNAINSEELQLGVSGSNLLEEEESSEQNTVQSCTIATSEDIIPSESISQSCGGNESECLPDAQLPDQTENIQMDIPCDSDNLTEPAQSNQPDSVTSEPMDVDE